MALPEITPSTTVGELNAVIQALDDSKAKLSKTEEARINQLITKYTTAKDRLITICKNDIIKHNILGDPATKLEVAKLTRDNFNKLSLVAWNKLLATTLNPHKSSELVSHDPGQAVISFLDGESGINMMTGVKTILTTAAVAALSSLNIAEFAGAMGLSTAGLPTSVSIISIIPEAIGALFALNPVIGVAAGALLGIGVIKLTKKIFGPELNKMWSNIKTKHAVNQAYKKAKLENDSKESISSFMGGKTPEEFQTEMEETIDHETKKSNGTYKNEFEAEVIKIKASGKDITAQINNLRNAFKDKVIAADMDTILTNNDVDKMILKEAFIAEALTLKAKPGSLLKDQVDALKTSYGTKLSDSEKDDCLKECGVADKVDFETKQNDGTFKNDFKDEVVACASKVGIDLKTEIDKIKNNFKDKLKEDEMDQVLNDPSVATLLETAEKRNNGTFKKEFKAEAKKIRDSVTCKKDLETEIVNLRTSYAGILTESEMDQYLSHHGIDKMLDINTELKFKEELSNYSLGITTDNFDTIKAKKEYKGILYEADMKEWAVELGVSEKDPNLGEIATKLKGDATFKKPTKKSGATPSTSREDFEKFKKSYQDVIKMIGDNKTPVATKIKAIKDLKAYADDPTKFDDGAVAGSSERKDNLKKLCNGMYEIAAALYTEIAKDASKAAQKDAILRQLEGDRGLAQDQIGKL